MSSRYKLFSKELTRRLTKKLEDQKPCSQAGFRNRFNTEIHIPTINQVIKKVQEFKLPLYMTFVDYSKAFDSVEHSIVLQALQNQGGEAKYIRILESLYTQSNKKEKTERVGYSFQLGRGVRQDDPMSPKLCTCVLEDIFRKLNWENRWA